MITIESVTTTPSGLVTTGDQLVLSVDATWSTTTWDKLRTDMSSWGDVAKLLNWNQVKMR